MTLGTLIAAAVADDETREEPRVIVNERVAPTRAEAGCANYDFHVDAEVPNVFVCYENWKSQSDLDAHLNAPHLRPLFGRLQVVLARPFEMRFLTESANPRPGIQGACPDPKPNPTALKRQPQRPPAASETLIL